MSTLPITMRRIRTGRLLLLLALVGFATFCAKPLFFTQPSPWARKSARKIDYQTMQFVFRTNPLPPSLKITGVDYNGYSVIFNGPDGPLYSNYEITVDSGDFHRLLNNFEKDITSREPFGRVWSAADALGSDLHEVYREQKYSSSKEPDMMFFQLVTKDSSKESGPWSIMVVDDRTSPTLKLYLHTRAYFYLPKSNP